MNDLAPAADRRRTAVVLTVLILATFAGCASGSVPANVPGFAPGLGASAPDRPLPANPPARVGLPASPVRPPDAPLLRSAGEFDRAPCAVLVQEELLGALAEPYFVLTGQTLALGGRPNIGAGLSKAESGGAGCGFPFAGEGTDVADAFHSVVVRVTRWRSGGPQRMADCQAAAAAAAKAPPARHRAVELRDEGCLGPGAVIQVRAGRVHYSIALVVSPRMANTSDEDFLLAPMALAAAQVAAPRLPAG